MMPDATRTLALFTLLGACACGRQRGSNDGGGNGNHAEASSGGATSEGGGGAAASQPQALLDRGTAHPISIEVDGEFLYWAEADPFRIYRAAKSGDGTVDQIGAWSGVEITKRMIAVDEDAIYWLDETLIRKRSKADGSETSIEIGKPPVEGGWFMTTDETFVYFADRDADTIGKVSKAGGKPQYFETSKRPNASGTYLAVDADSLYCGNFRDLLRFDKEGGAATQLTQVGEGERVGALVSDGQNVYFANNRGILGTRQENLAMLPKLGGTLADLGVIGDGTAVLRLDKSMQHLFWTTKGGTTDDRVLTYSIAERKLEILYTGQPIYGGMAEDERYVYWSAENTIMRLAK